MSQAPPILIAGAGPVGLVTAIVLRQHSIPVRIIEKEPVPKLASRASGIMPRTLEIYHFLGVLPYIMKAAGQAPVIVDYEIPGGERVLETFRMFPHVDATPSRPFLQCKALSQSLSQDILRAHLARFGTEVEMGTELHDFEQCDDHVVARIVKKSADGKESTESYSASYLVGTDGAKGITRRRLGLTLDGESRENLSFVFADIRLRGLGGNFWHKWGEISDKMITIRKTEFSKEHFWLLAGGQNLDTNGLQPNPKSVTEWIKLQTGRGDIEIVEVINFSNYKPSMRMVKEFSKGRVFLAGDAAHIHSPAGGQGLNNGIADAWLLSWRLALAHKGLASAELLASYTAERAPVIKVMLEQTTAILNAQIAATWGKFGYGNWRPDKAPLWQLDINYRWSPVVFDETATAVSHETASNTAPGVQEGNDIRAGDRAPDAPSLLDILSAPPSVKRLFDYFKSTQHTVLVFASSEAKINTFASALNNVPAEVVQSAVIIPQETPVREQDLETEFTWTSKVDHALKDCDAHMYRAYRPEGSQDEVAVIVRPDDIIGAIVKSGEGITKYFSKILAA